MQIAFSFIFSRVARLMSVISSQFKTKTQSAVAFFIANLEKHIALLKKRGILQSIQLSTLKRILNHKVDLLQPSLLHGLLSTQTVFINDKLKVATLANMFEPIAGDPHYDLAGFLLYDGLDRAKRLIQSYYLLGGNVEWLSQELIQTSLRRTIASMYWRIHRGQMDSILSLRHLMITLIEQYLKK